MGNLYKQAKTQGNVSLFLPESFEWLLLNSGIIFDSEIKTVLSAPEEHIDGKYFFSWE